MYLESPGSGDASVTFSLNKAVATSTRKWKIKISQIACSSTYRPPSDCTQYFTGAVGGPVRTYSFARALKNQDYTTCIRRESGMCKIMWTERATTTPDSFGITPVAIITPGIAPALPTAGPPIAATGSNCATAFLEINDVTGPLLNRLCGGVLNPVDGQGTSAAITGTNFNIRYFSDNADKTEGTGYNLQYAQVPC